MPSDHSGLEIIVTPAGSPDISSTNTVSPCKTFLPDLASPHRVWLSWSKDFSRNLDDGRDYNLADPEASQQQDGEAQIFFDTDGLVLNETLKGTPWKIDLLKRINDLNQSFIFGFNLGVFRGAGHFW